MSSHAVRSKHGNRRRAPGSAVAVLAALSVVLVSCTPTHRSAAGPTDPAAAPGAQGTAAAAPTTSPVASCGEPTASLRPRPGPPDAADYTADGSLARILARGYLTIGIDQSAYPFSYADAVDNSLQGFDIDLVREIAKDLFGSADSSRLRFRVVPNAVREQSVANGVVDIVAKSVTINCRRRAVVDFSSTYYAAGQRVLVLRGTPADAADHTRGLAGLPPGTRMCTVGGTTAAENVRATRGLVDVSGDTWADCLVRIQQGAADAAVGDDTIMVGLQAQDRYLRLVGPKLSHEPYGLEIAKEHPDLVRFVNASLQRVRADGTWTRLYDTHLARFLPADDRVVPQAVYAD
ncbi:transporter substrate-binding domain-containing protein [Embleya sp. NBC_00896]|uniref:transporter substrate-binding domain-containing protein n=1 Tax=Embleya sp. NBC_00896 TaxID=2975961 RepID=UPI00386EAF98|nr:transporter substrate-binding domain-containing protein [Embleya sp. NBC_00896]